MAIKTNIKDFRPTREKFSKSIRLLSGCFTTRKFFPQGEVTIYPWDSTMDEWVVQNKTTDSHDFLIQAVKRVTALGTCPIGQMVFGDLHTILLVSMAMRNKSVYVHNPKCASCGFVHPEDIIQVPEGLTMVGKKEMDFSGVDEFTLDDCGDVVAIRPLTVADILKIDQRNEIEKATLSDARAQLIWGVVSIGGGAPETLDEVNTWYLALSPSDQSLFDLNRQELEPHLSEEVKYKCDKCHAEFSVTLQLDTNFFRRRVRKGPSRSVAQSVGTS